jgi:hypothetical protein
LREVRVKNKRPTILCSVALDNLGRAIFGAEYIDRLSWRDTWLLQQYNPNVDDRSSIETPPEYWTAERESKFKHWQDRSVIQWLEDNGLIGHSGSLPLSLDRASFTRAFKRIFPDVPLVLKRASDPKDGPRGGRPRIHDWEGAIIEIVRMAAHPDGLPDKQTQVAQMVADWFMEKTGGHPAMSQIHERVKRVYDAVGRKS